MTEAHAVTEDGRDVRITQDGPGAPVVYSVADDRFTDGWRVIDNGDEVADLIGSINRAQAAAAAEQPVLLDPDAGDNDVVVDPDPDAPAPDGDEMTADDGT